MGVKRTTRTHVPVFMATRGCLFCRQPGQQCKPLFEHTRPLTKTFLFQKFPFWRIVNLVENAP